MRLINLSNERYKEIMAWILMMGGEAFLYSLCVSPAERKSNSRPCPVCCKSTSKKPELWMIANSEGVALFNDRFNEEACARRMISWLKHIYAEYKKLVPLQNGTSFTEDKLIFYLLPGDDSDFNKVSRRQILNILSLTEFVSKAEPTE